MAAAPLDFEALADLRTYLGTLRQHHLPTMNHYATSGGQGFWHYPGTLDVASLSSTATCVSSLVHSRLWKDGTRRWGAASEVAEYLMTKPWQSAGLEEDNPFSLSFIVQGVLDLCSYEPYERQNEHKSAIRDEIVPILLREIDSDDGALSTRGSIRIEPYPPSAYLTQLVFRTLTRLLDPSGDDHKRVSGHVRVWARGEIYRQLALIASDSRIADPLQLAYATILLATASPDEDLSPEEKGLTREALKKFFSCQLTDGTWPASQPLFHYPKVGNALCFDYELLAELLRCQPLQLDLLEFLPELRNAVTHLRHSAFEIRRNISAWASGHHPQIQGPESWSTASVYDFIHALDRLVAEAVRRTLFKEVRAVYQPPERSSEEPRELDGFAPTFLDADVKVDGKKRSLRRTLRDYFVVPISREKHIVANGGQLSAHTPMSAILFGPPGTSKTQLAKMIGKFLGWPVLSIDPSYLVQDGIDRLYARANKLFSMLTMTEQVVVLLDEFDELGRDRSQSPEILSRFITTSMLPKLAAVNDERKLVFLLATNFVTQFDAAFSRRGRFDMILQVMPPTASAKQGYGPWSEILSASLGDLQGKLKKQALDCLADLTFLETQQLVSKLADRDGDPHDDFLLARDRGTLNQPNGDRGTWKESSREEEPLNRLPLVSVQAQAPLPLKTRRRRRQSRREAAATNAVQGPAV